MRNRIRHLLADWNAELPGQVPSEPDDRAEPQPGGHGMPHDTHLPVPVELCVNRDLLVSLLSASIREIQRHQRTLLDERSPRERAEVEAALQQQLAFRSWARSHPESYISIAMYPVADPDAAEDLEDPGEL